MVTIVATRSVFMSNKRKTYSAEFKREAVRLLEKSDKKVAVLARELGIARN